MSLITRCPACRTMFKVVPDQLRISEGWVRCGHCAEVFDASSNMQEGAEPASVSPPPAEPVAPPATLHDDPAPSSSGFGSSIDTHVDDTPSVHPGDSEIEEEARELEELPEDRPFEFRREDIGGPQAAAAAVLPGDATPPMPVEPGPPAPEPEPELHDLSFVKQARRQAFWRNPATRVALAAAAVLLAVSLGLQIAYRERDRLAVIDPDWRPFLLRMCGVFGCTIGAPRQIESIAIDNSSFNRVRGDTFRLNVTLKNQSPLEVALPALELTLTDSQDQAVIRRVLLPADFAPGVPAIAARADWSGSLELSVAANGLGSRVAGYRLLAFYP